MTKRCTDGSPSEKGRQIACVSQSRAQLVLEVGQGPQGFPGWGDQVSLYGAYLILSSTSSGHLGRDRRDDQDGLQHRGVLNKGRASEPRTRHFPSLSFSPFFLAKSAGLQATVEMHLFGRREPK